MVDELMRRFRDRGNPVAAEPSATAHVTLAAVNPEPQPAPETVPAGQPGEETIEEGGCFAVAHGQRTTRGFRVRLDQRYFSCQYAAFLRTGEVSGWDADLGKEALYVVFHWGTLVVAGKGLDVIDELLNDHKLARLSIGEGKRGVRVDNIRVLVREAAPIPSTKRRS